MRKILSTVGTSIFENLFQMDGGNSNHNGISEYKQLKKDDLSYSQWGQQKLRIETLRKALAKNDQGPCAEIASILAIQKELKEEITVHLLATDTILSVLAAELIKNWFENEDIKGKYPGISAVHFDPPDPSFDQQTDSKHVIRKLRIDRQSNFEEGIMNLLEVLNKVCTKEAILNITGGYKGIIPIVTIWAQIKKVPLKYLFRESELDSEIQPLTLENLPVNFDYSLFEDNYIAFESIKPSKQYHNLPSIDDFKASLSDFTHFKILHNSFIIQEVDSRIRLTSLGVMLYKQHENSLKEDGFSMSNLVGKVMEIKVYEYFRNQHPGNEVVLGKEIGKSPAGDPYDLDIFVQFEQSIWAIEVKPEGAMVLVSDGMLEKDKKKTIEYKFKTGAFKSAIDQFNNKSIKLCLFMYHHQRPNKYQVENVTKLMQLDDIPGKEYFHWIWINPPENYKGNVNWSIKHTQMKRFDFSNNQWEEIPENFFLN